jgi:3'-phosphoadenosine 5'-phosphosulfate (PAPS) 3'-phosphatase
MRGFGRVGYKVSRLFFGEADLYVHQKGLKEWDTCAPEAVARALGWSVSTLSGTEHRYNRENPRNDEIVVCRPPGGIESSRACGSSAFPAELRKRLPRNPGS